jgi:hypothetical protein
MAQGFLFYSPRYRPTNSNGAVLPSSTVQFLYSETDIPAPVYSDVELVFLLSSPVQADSTGKYPPIYMDPSIQYRVQLYDRNGVLQEDTDPFVVPSGGSSSGSNGTPGVNAVSLRVTTPSITVPADSAGVVLDFGGAQGLLTVYNGTTDVTSSSLLQVTSAVGVTGTINTAANTPVGSQPMGFYQITAMSTLTGSLSLQATYNGNVYGITIIITKAIAGATGTPGSGTSALSIYLSSPFYNLSSYADGSVPSYSGANGILYVFSGTTDVTASCTLSAVAGTGVTGTINTATNTPVNGQIKGYYQITSLTTSSGTLALTAVYSGATLNATFTITKVNVGYELVTSLPVTNLFNGRIVFNTVTGILYKYNGTAWVNVVNASDLTGQLTAAQIASITAAQLTGTLTTTQIGPNTIQTGNLSAASVTTAQLAAGSVTTATLGAGSVTATNISAGAVTANAIAANSITTNALQAGSVTAATIAANTITAAQLSSGTLITNSAQIGTGVIGSAQIGNLSVTSLKLANNSVTIPVGASALSGTDHPSNSGIDQSILSVNISLPSSTQMLSITGSGVIRWRSIGSATKATWGVSLTKNASGIYYAYDDIRTIPVPPYVAGQDRVPFSFSAVDTDTTTTGLRSYDMKVYAYTNTGQGVWAVEYASLIVTALLR